MSIKRTRRHHQAFASLVKGVVCHEHLFNTQHIKLHHLVIIINNSKLTTTVNNIHNT